jgi:tetratricopeptide (TPR) repeat protein
MVDPRLALQPLDEAESSYERLRSYDTPAELAERVAEIWRAAERALRLYARSDTAAPDAVRLNALAPNIVAIDEIVAHLRRRDLISLELAGLLHELQRAATRAAAGSMRAADADAAAQAYTRLVAELSEQRDRAIATAAHERVVEGVIEPQVHDVPAPADRRRVRRLMLFAALIFFIGGIAMLVTVIRGPVGMEEQAIAAFRGEDFVMAERGFRIVLDRDPENVTALLYLGRIYRRQGRMNEAADVLQMAAGVAPGDADVRRELGHLFLDLNRPDAAATQFRHAVEQDPEEPANWIGLIQALRAAGDPMAEEWLRRAPASVRAAMTR